MATRLYPVANSTPNITPAWDPGWISTANGVRRDASLTQNATTETIAGTVTSGANNNSAALMMISPPLAAQTISGTVSVVSRGQMLAANDGINKRWRSVRVVSADGLTIRATMDTLVATASTTALGTTLQGQSHALNSGFTSFTCQDGDRIVVGVGYGMSATGTTPQWNMQIGGSGTDHANANSDTTGTVMWVEFSQNLTWQVTPSSVTLTPAVATSSATAVTATPVVTLTPASLTSTATALVATINVTLTPAVATSSAIPITVGASASSVTLSSAVSTSSAVAVTATPGAVSMTLTPAILTTAAVSVSATPGATSVTLTPAILTTSGRVADPNIPGAPWVRDSRQSGTGASTSLTHSVAIPTCQVGDDLWASFTLNAGHGTITAPAGWTVASQALDSNGTMSLVIYRKTATATEVSGGSVTVTVATAVRGNAGAVSIANADTGVLDSSVSAAGTGNVTTATSFSTTVPNTLVLTIVAIDSSTEAATPPSSAVERWDPTASGITGQANAGATLIKPTTGSSSWNWSWTTAGLEYKTWAGAIKPAAVGNSVTLTPAAVTITAPAITATPNVTLTPAVATSSARVITATPSTTLTPVTSTVSAVSLTVAPGATTVTLTPAGSTTSAPAVSATPGAVSITLTPVTRTITAVPVAVSVGPTSVTLTPATLTMTAFPLGVGGVSVVALSAATLTATALAVTTTVGPTSVTLTAAVATTTARTLTLTPIVPLTPATTATTAVPVSATAGSVGVTLTPAIISVQVFPLGVGGVSVITLSSAILLTSAQSLTATPGSVSVALTSATMTIGPRVVTATPGPININITPAQATILASPVSLSGVLYTINLTPAKITFTAPQLVAYVTTPGVDLMTIAFMTVTGVGEYIRGELENTEGGVPQRFASIVPGTIAWDNCDCGQFAQSITSVVSSRAFPTPATDVPVAPCGHPEAVVSVTMSLLRCVPGMDDNGNPPDVGKLLASARVIEDDRLALRRGVAAYLRQLRQNYAITNYTVGAAQSVGPEGMCGGVELTYSFGIHNDAVTCG